MEGVSDPPRRLRTARDGGLADRFDDRVGAVQRAVAGGDTGLAVGTTVTATATPVHRGRRTQVWTTRIETEEGKLVGIVTQTQMVL